MKTIYAISADTNYLTRIDGDIRTSTAATKDQLYIDPTNEFEDLGSAIEAIDGIINSDPMSYVETFDRYGNLTCITYVDFEVAQYTKYEEGDDDYDASGYDNYEYVACVFDRTTKDCYDPKKSGKLC